MQSQIIEKIAWMPIVFKLLEGILEERRREIIKEWINSGKIEGI